jgi:hypothetical protein
MELIPPDDFFEWINSNGIGYNEEYPDSNDLRYGSIAKHARFWRTPFEARRVPFFIHRLLSGLSPWNECIIWPHEGYWPHAEIRNRIDFQVRDTFLRAAGIPDGFCGAAKFPITEHAGLVSAIFAQVIFGWSDPDDVYVIPDHARQFLETDHHDVIHASFSSESQVQPFIDHMAAVDFPLPDELPDWTFIKPPWME